MSWYDKYIILCSRILMAHHGTSVPGTIRMIMGVLYARRLLQRDFSRCPIGAMSPK
jgi:hypothetical protein